MNSIDIFVNANKKLGTTTEKACEAFSDFAALIPPFTKGDILRIKANPSLSFIDKIRIIRSMKKQMKGER